MASASEVLEVEELQEQLPVEAVVEVVQESSSIDDRDVAFADVAVDDASLKCQHVSYRSSMKVNRRLIGAYMQLQ